MNDPSLKSVPTTCADLHNATSSQESEDGRSRSGSPDGLKHGERGQQACHASRSVSPATSSVSQTSAICGLHSSDLSGSADLQQSLESKLRLRMLGSPLCAVVWKDWITPWGQYLSKPRAQVGINCATAISLWPALTSNAPARNGYNEAGNSAGQVAIRKIIVGLWSALRASDGAKGGPNMSFGAGGCPLPSQVSATAKSSNAPTEGFGLSLHPEFAGWEMRFPPEWLSCAPSETPSTRK